MKPNPSCFTKQKFRFENEGERDFEKKRTDEIPYTNLCSLLDVILSIRASLLFSLYVFAIYVLALFLCLCLLFLSSFFFFFLSYVLPLFIETPKELFPYFSLNWSDHGTVFANFSSTIPYSMLSHEPLFSFLLFLFAPFAF